MKIKRILSTTAVLFALTLLTTSLLRVSAVPLSPYIMILPEKTLNEALTPGSTYTITIYTDYAVDNDIWAWQFGLTFNPAVLSGASVTNGDLITTAKNPTAIFLPGTFNNTEGRLSLTAAYFDYTSPPPPTTSGPGTFATVSFNVIGYGFSDITLVDEEVKLIGAIGSTTYSIINGFVDYEQIGHGYFRNTLTGDVNGDKVVDVVDAASVSAHWYPGPPIGPLGYGREADINLDGLVGITDAALVSANWHRTAP